MQVHVRFPAGISPGAVQFRYLDTGESFRADPLSSDGTYLLGEGSGDPRPLLAVYPADAPVTVADGRLYFEIPPEQDGTLRPLFFGQAQAAGGYEVAELALTPMYQVLTLDLGRTPFVLRNLELTPSDGSLLSGRSWVDLSTGERGASQSKVTVTPAAPLTRFPGS